MAPRTGSRWLALLLTACATPLDERQVEVAHVARRWLPAIAEGTTRRSDLEAAFGAPTMAFEDGRVVGWILQLHEDATRIGLDADGRAPGQRSLGSGSERSARRERIDRSGELRVVSAADLRERALWPTRREAEFHLVVRLRDDVVQQHSLLRVVP